jgi:aldose 1-epimerase
MWDKATILKDIELKMTIPDKDGKMKTKIGSGVKFSRISNHNEDGFPGEMTITSSYIMTPDNELYFHWKCWLSADNDQSSETITPIDMSNNTYWNLSEKNESIASHTLYLPNTTKMVEENEIIETSDTRFDFCIHTILDDTFDQGGINNSFLVD